MKAPFVFVFRISAPLCGMTLYLSSWPRVRCVPWSAGPQHHPWASTQGSKAIKHLLKSVSLLGPLCGDNEETGYPETKR